MKLMLMLPVRYVREITKDSEQDSIIKTELLRYEVKTMDKTLIFRGGCVVENLATANEDYIPSLEHTDFAVTLMARDYKGLKNFNSNAVIEIYEVTNESES